MFKFFNKLLAGFKAKESREEGEETREPEETREELERRTLIATVVLLMEIAAGNNPFSLSESVAVYDILRDDLGIPDAEAKKIMRISEEHLNYRQDLKEYTDLINRNFSREEKLLLLERFWKVVYSDGMMDRHENLLVTKLAEYLNMSRHDLIETKISGRTSQ